MEKIKRTMIENKAFFLATSDENSEISSDPDSPSFLTSLLLENNSGDFAIVSETGSVKNISERTIKLLTGLLSFQPNKSGGGTSVMHIWSERSTDEGSTWTQNSNSLRVIEISNNGETFKSTISYVNDLLPQECVRFRSYIYSGGNVNLETPTTTVLNDQIISGHSIIWNLQEA